MRCVYLLLLAAILVSCAQDRPSPGALQRFDRLRRSLATVTTDDSKLALCMIQIRNAMRTGARTAIARDAVLLQVHGVRLARSTRRPLIAMQPLVMSVHPGPVRTYLKLLVSTLRWQVAEGRSAEALGALLRQDPLVTSGPDERLLRLRVDAVRWDAWRAVLTSRQAVRVRLKRPNHFRYQSVPRS